jgi:uncharacterized protein YutE (UPF0331/DUF86 family)
MFENFKIKREVKKLKNVPVNGQFLDSLKNKLIIYMDSNPVMEKKEKRLILQQEERSNFITLINKIKLMPIPIIIALIAILSGGGVTMASQNSLPGDTLYPVKIAVEDVRAAITISSESKAKLHIGYAKERADEIKKLLENKDVAPKGLEIALNRLEKNINKANEAIAKEKQKGKDESALEKEIGLAVGASKDALKENAQNAITGAETAKQKLLDELAKENIVPLAESFKQYDDFIVKARTALDEGRYVQARQHAKQAEDALKHVSREVEKTRENIEKQKENGTATTTEKGNGKNKEAKND